MTTGPAPSTPAPPVVASAVPGPPAAGSRDAAAKARSGSPGGTDRLGARDKASAREKAAAPSTASRPGWVWVAVAFVGGLLLMAWVMTNWDRLWSSDEPVAGAAVPVSEATATPELARLAGSVDPVTGRAAQDPFSPPAAPAATAIDPATATRAVGTLGAQMDALEARLAGVRAAADGAAADSSRAEAMLLAFAARRTLDRGVPLGFLQAQLRQRFPAQPRAVDTVVEAAANPVTVESLRAALPSLALRRESRFGGLFSTLSGEGRPLIRFVRGNEARDDPQSRLEDADAALARGDVDAALTLISGLPATEARVQWVRSARRHVAARQALDVIETAAILQGGKAENSVP